MTGPESHESGIMGPDDFYIFGGQCSHRKSLDSIEQINLATKKSEMIGKLPLITCSDGFIDAENEKIAHLIGGYNDYSTSNKTCKSSFDNLLNWTSGFDMIEKRRNQVCVYIKKWNFDHLRLEW